MSWVMASKCAARSPERRWRQQLPAEEGIPSPAMVPYVDGSLSPRARLGPSQSIRHTHRASIPTMGNVGGGPSTRTQEIEAR